MVAPAHEPGEEVAPTDRRDIWRRTKQLEGLPGEWSAPIWSHRAIALHDRLSSHYEPLRGLRDIDGAINIFEGMAAAGMAEGERPSLMMTTSMFSSGYVAPRGSLPLPSTQDRFVGSHALTIVGRTASGDFSFRNTWGVEWGDRGYGTMPRAYAKRYMHEAWVVRLHFLGPSPYKRISDESDPTKLLQSQAGRDAFRRAWAENNRGALLVEGRRAVASVLTGLPNQEVVVAVRIYPDSGERPLGWIHLKALSGRRWLVEEWFVDPEHRQQGHGAALLRWAQKDAGRRGGTRLVLRLLVADDERNRLMRDVAVPQEAREISWAPVRDHPVYAAGATLPVIRAQ